MAWCASGGLQAPRIRNGSMSASELGLHGGLDVDLGEDSEALLGERGSGAIDDVVERERTRGS